MFLSYEGKGCTTYAYIIIRGFAMEVYREWKSFLLVR